ncbi:hypothetical protein TNCV_154741 [Trichonephila clavipes]|uniref:Uncharacterized protein n=1 Tax=Trichonephila clavipes TaxID=2585209 RepID=A0A8X6WJE3_TRICX|nr:hypothetical protein TNCV_154741 [Trichonephila clavipes]
MNKIQQALAGLDYCTTTVPSEEFVAADDDKMCTAPVIADKDILEFVQSSKNIVHTHSDDESEMNNSTPVPTSFEMRNITKNILSYLDAHSNGEMNHKMDDIEHFVAKKTMQRKMLFSKNSINV